MKHSQSLKKNADFQIVYKEGKSFANKYLVMYVKENDLGINRIGISVSKKVGNSVVRHRVKRLILESYRLHEDMFNSGLDMVIIARTTAKDKGYHDDMKNAKHVGIYLGGMEVEHSTRNNTSNGVQMDSITSARWTNYALLNCVDYGKSEPTIIDCLRLIGKSSLFDIYQAAKTLWG